VSTGGHPRQRRRHDRVPSSPSTTSGCPTTRSRSCARSPRPVQGVGAEDESCRGLHLHRRPGLMLPRLFSSDASSGTPLFTDGPFIESKEHPRRLRRRGCGRRGGRAAVGPERSRWPAVAAGGATLPGPQGNFRRLLNGVGGRSCREVGAKVSPAHRHVLDIIWLSTDPHDVEDPDQLRILVEVEAPGCRCPTRTRPHGSEDRFQRPITASQGCPA